MVPFALAMEKWSLETFDRNENAQTNKPSVETIAANIKDSLKLVGIRMGMSCGRDIVTISEQDLPKIFDIAREFVQQGYQIYMQDGTQVSFDDVKQVSQQGQEKLLLESLVEIERTGGADLCIKLCKLPIHRSDFWSCEEGKNLAARLRIHSSDRLLDKLDPEEMTIGEYFYEQNKKKTKTTTTKNNIPTVLDGKGQSEVPTKKTAKTEELGFAEVKQNDCVICFEKKADTLVEPCGHVVVCRRCSDGLKKDIVNAHICVICRQAIQYISNI